MEVCGRCETTVKPKLKEPTKRNPSYLGLLIIVFNSSPKLGPPTTKYQLGCGSPGPPAHLAGLTWPTTTIDLWFWQYATVPVSFRSWWTGDIRFAFQTSRGNVLGALYTTTLEAAQVRQLSSHPISGEADDRRLLHVHVRGLLEHVSRVVW
jgi:hypothetical protein